MDFLLIEHIVVMELVNYFIVHLRIFNIYYRIPHYGKNKAPGFMKVGHTFTIEPMIN